MEERCDSGNRNLRRDFITRSAPASTQADVQAENAKRTSLEAARARPILTLEFSRVKSSFYTTCHIKSACPPIASTEISGKLRKTPPDGEQNHALESLQAVRKKYWTATAESPSFRRSRLSLFASRHCRSIFIRW